MTDKPKIYFLGSGDIAVPILKKLAAAPELELVGVGTQIDRPAGRSRRMVSTPVGIAADEMGLCAERLPSVNAPDFLASLRLRQPDLVVVVSFGQILKAELLALPRAGCVNIHASLLPKYRGASPIAQALLNRDAVTGVTFMGMVKGLDTGPIYQTIILPLDGREYANTLELKLGVIAADAAVGILLAVAGGELKSTPQNEAAASLCTKISKADGEIDFHESAVLIESKVRAYTPWPGAVFGMRTSKGEIRASITRAIVRRDLPSRPGEIVQADKFALIVGCGSGALEIVELAPAGKRAMRAVEFLNGLRGEKPKILP